MSKILYIKANANQENSRTFKISDSFIEEYKQNNPNDEIITLDLYKEKIDFLPPDQLKQLRMPQDETTARKHPILKYAFEFLEADKYVIAEPLWNLGVPAILKAYIDYITVTGITFTYTENGPVGLCKGKKAVNITSRGGDYSAEPFASLEMCDNYLRTILGFLGITDFTTVAANALDIIGNDVDAIVNDAINKAKELAKTF